MTVRSEERGRWSIEDAERLLMSLNGVLSARVVARPGGAIDEIHLLTTDTVKPKQTVRNVESALLSYFDLSVDHRKISVAQTGRRPPTVETPVIQDSLQILKAPEPRATEGRLLFVSHRIESERAGHIRHRVDVEWGEELFTGEAVGADVPKAKLERRHVTLALDGAKLVDAFDHTYVLVAVHAISGRHIQTLSGATPVTGSPDRAAIMATLQATDRWVRGQL